MADQCIVCLDGLDVQQSPPSQPSPPKTPHHSHTISQALSSASCPTTAGDAATSPLLSHTGADDDDHGAIAASITSPRLGDNNKIAVIQVCGHILHDACLREWTGKANSCPICRQAFHLVHVYDKVGGELPHASAFAYVYVGEFS